MLSRQCFQRLFGKAAVGALLSPVTVNVFPRRQFARPA